MRDEFATSTFFNAQLQGNLGISLPIDHIITRRLRESEEIFADKVQEQKLTVNACDHPFSGGTLLKTGIIL